MKQKQKGHSKISEEIKKSLYNWIIHNPQVVQSPIANGCIKVKTDGYTGPQLVPKLLLHVSVRELHKNLVSTKKDGGLKEARYEDDNIPIIDCTLRLLFPPQLNKSSQDTRSFVIVNVVYLPKLFIHQYYHGVIVVKKNLKDIIQNAQNRRSGEKANLHI